ncbi:hypothetical protein BpHYR1_037402 [Brachionus plicatilis]|uniref:Uncharacterized protein n=1 Tax=Brachionus plicatilis TaxID=10195 RepID=A0A3M7SPV1_BRAPC|nr:hypothetical protein BpHYR1_037402 [Brachionus plicatilis]
MLLKKSYLKQSIKVTIQNKVPSQEEILRNSTPCDFNFFIEPNFKLILNKILCFILYLFILYRLISIHKN